MSVRRSLALLPVLLLAAGCGPAGPPMPHYPVPPLFGQHSEQAFTKRSPQWLRPFGSDLVTVDQGGTLSDVWIDGAGQFSAPVAVDLGTPGPVVDARVDPLGPPGQNQILALLPTEVEVLDYQDRHTFKVPATGGHLAPGSGYRDLLVGDFNNDGNADLFIVGDKGSTEWLGPDFKAPQVSRPPSLLPDPPPVLDDVSQGAGDDVVGMVQGPNGPELVALLGQQVTGLFVVQVAPPLPSGDTITAIASGGFADGSSTDVLVAGKGFLALYPRTRDDHFGKPRVARVKGLDPLAVVAVPYGGGKSDGVMVTNRDGKLLTFLGPSKGSAEFVEAPPRTLGPSPTGLALAAIYHNPMGEASEWTDIVVSTEGTCCPLGGASVQAFSGGAFTGHGVATLSFKPVP